MYNTTKRRERISFMSNIKAFTAILMMFFGGFTWAQTSGIVQIGSGTSTVSGGSAMPVSNYVYNYSQQIVGAGEIAMGGGAIGDITSISYHATALGSNPERWNELTIYIANTDKTSFDSDTDWVDFTELTEVYSGSISPVANEWFVIEFDTPFAYTGGNLIVAVHEDVSGWTSPAFLSYASGSNTGIMYRSDSTNPSPASPPSAYARVSNLPQIQLNMQLADCVPPSDISFTNITYSSADLNWVSDGNNFNIKWGEAGFDFDTEGTLVNGFANGGTLNGLDAETNYQFYVQEDCGGTISSWAGPFDFFTGYCEVSTGTSTSYRIYGFNTSDGYTNIINPDNGTSNSYNNFSNMSVTQSAGESISYAVDVPSYTNVEIWIDFNNDMIFSSDELVAEHTYNWSATTFTGSIDVPTGTANGDYRMRVRSRYYYNTTAEPCGYMTYGETEDYTLSVVPIPTCLPPSDLSTSNTTAESVDLSWTSDGSTFNIIWGEEGFDPDTEGTTETGFANGGTLGGLTGNTNYQYYVQNDCGGGDVSFWAGPYPFKTLCTAETTLPYTENFDSYSAGDFPDCWERPITNVSGTSTWPSIVSYYLSPSPSNSMKFQSQVGTATYAVTPAFEEDVHNLRLTFQLRKEGTSSGNIEVGVMSDPFDITTFEVVDTIEPDNTNFNEYVYYLNETILTGGNNHIAFRHNSNSAYWYYWIDDVVVDLIPTCFPPSNITVDDITKESAEVSWELPTLGNIPGDGYTVEIRTEGEPGEATGLVTTITVDEMMAAIDGLDPSTNYFVYVKSTCVEGDDISEWSEGIPFTTLCDYPDFELTNDEEELTICDEGELTLEVDTEGEISWYDAEDADEPAGTNSTFDTGLLTETTSFWLEVFQSTDGVEVQVGEGTDTTNTTGSPFYHGWGGYKYQYIFTAEELLASGMMEGDISGLAFDITQAATVDYNDFTIYMGTTEQDAATSTQQDGLTLVYTEDALATPVGITEYAFDQDFAWDGESNIVVQISWSNVNYGNYSAAALVTTHTTSPNRTTYTYADNATAEELLNGTVGFTTTTSRRPNIYFTATAGCKSHKEEIVVTVLEPEPFSISLEEAEMCATESTETITIVEGAADYDTFEWTPATGVAGDETTGWTLTPDETTTYTLTASQSEGLCVQTAEVVVTINPLPTRGDLAETYDACPEIALPLNTALPTQGIDANNITWAPFDNLYLDANGTYPYNGENIGQVYYLSNGENETTYDVTIVTSKGCEQTFETVVTTPEVITPVIDDVYLCSPLPVDEAVESDLNLVWYDSMDAVEPIDEFDQTATYYVENEVGICKSERVAVNIIVVGVFTPTGDAVQNYCDSTFIEDLMVNHTDGSTLNVYEVPVGGTPLPAGTALYTGTFYVSEQIADCESDRMMVEVTVSTTPPAIVPQTITICGFEVMANVEIGQQPNTEVIWYADETTSVPMNANSQVYEGTYYVTQKVGVCETERSAITFNVNDETPLPTASSQAFCGSAVVSDLVVTGLDGAIFQWFNSATSTTPLADDQALSNGTYYVSQEVDGCESNRKAISVQIVNNAAPQIASAMDVCEGITIGDVEIPATSGVTYKWYTTPIAVTSLPASTVLTNSTYYISSVYNGCESERVTVDVQTTPAPAAPTGEAQQAFVYEISMNEVTIADLVVNEGDVLWFISEEDAATLTNPLPDDMPLSNNTTYYAVVVGNGGCVSETFAVQVTVVLDNEKFDRTKLNYYPNPTNNVLNIEYISNIESVEIYNTIGQLVSVQEFNSNQVTVDMSKLSSGTYMLKLQIDGYQQLIKVMKK